MNLKTPREEREINQNKSPHWGKRALWFLLLWIGGVLTLGAISYGLKILFKIAY